MDNDMNSILRNMDAAAKGETVNGTPSPAANEKNAMKALLEGIDAQQKSVNQMPSTHVMAKNGAKHPASKYLVGGEHDEDGFDIETPEEEAAFKQDFIKQIGHQDEEDLAEYKNTYSVGDRVNTPFGEGEIIKDLGEGSGMHQDHFFAVKMSDGEVMKFGSFELKGHADSDQPIEEAGDLRAVKVTYSNGDEISTSMAAGLSDEDILDYFAIGKGFNIGDGRGGDKMVTVADVEILEGLDEDDADVDQGEPGLDPQDVVQAWKEVFPHSAAYAKKGALGGGMYFSFLLSAGRDEVASGILENDPLNYRASLDNNGTWSESATSMFIAPPEGSHLAFGSAKLRKKSAKNVTLDQIKKRFEQVKAFVTANADNMHQIHFDINEKLGTKIVENEYAYTSYNSNDIHPGVNVHIGHKVAGGSGIEGVVTKVEDGIVYIKNAEGQTYKGQLKNTTVQEAAFGERKPQADVHKKQSFAEIFKSMEEASEEKEFNMEKDFHNKIQQEKALKKGDNGKYDLAEYDGPYDADDDDEDEDYNLQDGMTVELVGPYAEKPGETFTLSDWNGHKGWIGDADGRGWYVRGDQIKQVEQDDDDYETSPWDESVNESEGEEFGVFFKGGSLGEWDKTAKRTFPSKEAAKDYAKRMNAHLTPGEKKYYKMRYVVRPMSAGMQENKDSGIKSKDARTQHLIKTARSQYSGKADDDLSAVVNMMTDKDRELDKYDHNQDTDIVHADIVNDTQEDEITDILARLDKLEKK